MVAINYTIYIDAPAWHVYEAVTTSEGLSSWWTARSKADPIQGTVAEFWFNNRYQDKMYIATLKKNSLVEWECIDGDKEWIGTRIRFDIQERKKGSMLSFSHYGWAETSDFFASCSYQWGIYMKSLKEYCEQGKGDPFGGETSG